VQLIAGRLPSLPAAEMIEAIADLDPPLAADRQLAGVTRRGRRWCLISHGSQGVSREKAARIAARTTTTSVTRTRL